MLLPLIELAVRPDQPDALRKLLTQLSSIEPIGIVDLLEKSGTRMMHAYADRYTFTIIETRDDLQIFEQIGSQVTRVWERGSKRDLAEVMDVVRNFGSYAAPLAGAKHLYTEESWYIWRDHVQGYLPRIKRRVFAMQDGNAAALHFRQTDVSQGELAEYVLELPGQSLLNSVTVRPGPDGRLEVVASEATHTINYVGF
jgi:hypothetical protein